MTDSATPQVIELARQPDFALGPSLVRPATLEVLRSGKRDILEPRVMQVLVALHRSHPHVVSRDDLIASCWEGRVVGDDAINRAIGRLRRLSEADYGSSFAIETIPRVGYRLVLNDPVETAADPMAAAAQRQAPTAATRRRLVLAGAAAAVALAGAGAASWYFTRAAEQPVSPEAAALIQRAYLTLRQASPAEMAQGLALFQQAVQQAPGSADAWGGLGLAYTFAGHYAPANAAANRLRARDAISHARRIDPRNAMAYEAETWLLPYRGAAMELEKVYRQALHDHPDYDGITLSRALFLSEFGRNQEAADMAARAVATAKTPDPALSWISIQSFWAAGRLAEADAAANQGFALFPRHASVWYSRVFLLMFSGRTDEALAMLNDLGGRPPGVPDEDVDSVALVATALKTQARPDIDHAATVHMAMAHRANGFAENAVGFLSALGDQDRAFAVAEALYFGRGFQISDLRYAAVQRQHAAAEDRNTRTLFLPWAKAMRRDPRFAPLVEELGLARYWRSIGVKPDYQAGKDI